METSFTCPNCGTFSQDSRLYESMMMLAEDTALFTVRCPSCSARISSLSSIPDDMREQVESIASQVGAGMGRTR